jgi:hypothetical protein
MRGRKSQRQAEVGDSLAILDPDRVLTGHRECPEQTRERTAIMVRTIAAGSASPKT